jgi:hypothetical protein
VSDRSKLIGILVNKMISIECKGSVNQGCIERDRKESDNVSKNSLFCTFYNFEEKLCEGLVETLSICPSTYINSRIFSQNFGMSIRTFYKNFQVMTERNIYKSG